jgi:hypothetical protein
VVVLTHRQVGVIVGRTIVGANATHKVVNVLQRILTIGRHQHLGAMVQFMTRQILTDQQVFTLKIKYI